MAAQPRPLQTRDSVWIRGGDGAPGRARSYVLEQLEGRIAEASAGDAALIASELVTNSVIHANVDSREVVVLELTTEDDRLRVAVTDSGSLLEPRMQPADPTTPGGFGLRLVDEISCAWGVRRAPGGTTRVWCDLRIGGQLPATGDAAPPTPRSITT